MTKYQGLYSDWQKTGGTMKESCERHGINPDAFYNYRSRMKRRKSSLLPIIIRPDDTKGSTVDILIERDGLTIKAMLADADGLVSVLKELSYA